MVKYVTIGYLLVAVTVVIHAVGTVLIGRYISRRKDNEKGEIQTKMPLLFFVSVVLVLVMILSLEILVWAAAYLFLLPEGEIGSVEEAVYFSFVTFTTLGYGDVTISEGWRVLGGIEALNGILLVGWSTAMVFAVVQRMWQDMVRSEQQNN